jgi:hypothetical protein
MILHTKENLIYFKRIIEDLFVESNTGKDILEKDFYLTLILKN